MVFAVSTIKVNIVAVMLAHSSHEFMYISGSFAWWDEVQLIFINEFLLFSYVHKRFQLFCAVYFCNVYRIWSDLIKFNEAELIAGYSQKARKLSSGPQLLRNSYESKVHVDFEELWTLGKVFDEIRKCGWPTGQSKVKATNLHICDVFLWK